MPARVLFVLFIAAIALAPVSASSQGTAEAPAAAAEKSGGRKASGKKPAKEKTPEELRKEAFAAGKRAYDRGDWLKAIAYLRPLAEYGDTSAMLLLGNMYAAGSGVGKDPKEAFTLYHRAALGNSLDGMVATGAMYQTGQGIGINTRLAIGWYERAARLGSHSGAFFYGIHKFQGSKGTTYDLKSDHEAAYRWFRIASLSPDRKLHYAAAKVAEKLEAKLPPDRVIEINREVKAWAPETLSDVGPNPEEVYIEDMRKAGKIIDPGKMPEEKPAIVPEKTGDNPEEKPAEEGEKEKKP